MCLSRLLAKQGYEFSGWIAVFQEVEADDGRYLVESTLAAGVKANLSCTIDRSYIRKSNPRLLKILRVPKALIIEIGCEGVYIYHCQKVVLPADECYAYMV
jgi:hypothetical protein